jgi:NRPS condensation-like uncharacterized protein
MRLSELKKLVDDASVRAAKFREDPQVAIFTLEQASGRHLLIPVEYAAIDSASNLECQAYDLLSHHDVVMTPENRTLFVLSDDGEVLQ